MAFLRNKLARVFLVLLVLGGLIVALFTIPQGHTAPILDAQGQPLAGSIASLEKVRLGGVDQWLVIRGQDVHNPVLLFLSGGPGSSELGRVLRYNQPLEEHFTLVIWEQRGCGKSYAAGRDKESLTVQRYVDDIIELSDMLRTRFGQDKVYLLGHSWGTIIGLKAAQQRPDLFYAYIGSAQMVAVAETDELIYEAVREHAAKIGNNKLVATLDKMGPPPYSGWNAGLQYGQLFMHEFQIFEAPNIRNADFLSVGSNPMVFINVSEYTLADKIGFFLGSLFTLNRVYPQMESVDFRQDAPTLDLPTYFVIGQQDWNAPYWQAEEYYQQLQAPRKDLLMLPDSGHGQIWSEADTFHAYMVDTVLAETLTARP